MKQIMWWAYLHQNGSIKVYRWFGRHKDRIENYSTNHFVRQVVMPFAADKREKAVEIVKLHLVNNAAAAKPLR